MQEGGVIMDVVTPEEADIAEEEKAIQDKKTKYQRSERSRKHANALKQAPILL